VSGFLTTETVSSSSGLQGGAEAGGFLTLPSPSLTHSSSVMPRQQENKLEQKPPERLVCGLPISPSYVLGLGPWGPAVFPGTTAPSSTESRAGLYPPVPIFPPIPSSQRKVTQSRERYCGVTGATESSKQRERKTIKMCTHTSILFFTCHRK